MVGVITNRFYRDSQNDIYILPSDEVYGKGTSKEQWDSWNRLTTVTEGSYRVLVK